MELLGLIDAAIRTHQARRQASYARSTAQRKARKAQRELDKAGGPATLANTAAAEAIETENYLRRQAQEVGREYYRQHPASQEPQEAVQELAVPRQVVVHAEREVLVMLAVPCYECGAPATRGCNPLPGSEFIQVSARQPVDVHSSRLGQAQRPRVGQVRAPVQ